MSKKGDPTFMAALAGGGIFEMGTAHEGDQAKLIKRLIDKGVKEGTILDTPEKIKGKLQDLLNEADIVKRKLYSLERKNGEILFIIASKYQLFYKELEFGITSHIIEKYLNIIYTIIYVYENNSVSFNTYREMGIFAMNFISDLTSEFLNEDCSLEDLMSNFRI
jgi:hypothetical protein